MGNRGMWREGQGLYTLQLLTVRALLPSDEGGAGGGGGRGATPWTCRAQPVRSCVWRRGFGAGTRRSTPHADDPTSRHLNALTPDNYVSRLERPSSSKSPYPLPPSLVSLSLTPDSAYPDPSHPRPLVCPHGIARPHRTARVAQRSNRTRADGGEMGRG